MAQAKPLIQEEGSNQAFERELSLIEDIQRTPQVTLKLEKIAPARKEEKSKKMMMQPGTLNRVNMRLINNGSNLPSD